MDADKKRLWVSGQFVEVTDEIYDAYMKGDRKMRYFESDLKAERFLMDENGQIKQVIPSREDSLDRLMDDNAEQFADRHESVEDMVLRRISIEWLYKALDTLTERERKLISLVNAMSRETVLRQYLDTVKGQYSHIYPPQPPRTGPSAYKADDLYQKMKKEEGRNQAPGNRTAIIRLLYAYEP